MQIEEGSCEYKIHIPTDSQFYSKITAEHLISLASTLTTNHIWHLEPFKLKYHDNSLISGKTHFGDCIVDEWAIIYILYEISRNYPDLLITCQDSDGEFLLIEAAHYLPRWVNPDSVDDRVFISNGQLHLISPQLSPQRPSIQQASELIRLGKAKASVAIQDCINCQLNKFPLAFEDNLHYAHIIVPRHIASILMACSSQNGILQNNSFILSLALNAFYNHQNISPVAIKSKYPAETNIVFLSSIPKLHFSLLCNDKSYKPPKSWLQLDQLATIMRNPGKYHKEYRWLDIGCKITRGFDLLYYELMVKTSADREEYEYHGYKVSDILKLLDPDHNNNNNNIMPGNADSNEFESKVSAYNQTLASNQQPDDESWMIIDESELTRLLEDRSGTSHVKPANSNKALSQLSSDIDQFLSKGEASYEGVDMGDDESDGCDGTDWSLNGSDESDGSDWEEEDGDFEIDEEMIQLMEMMDQEIQRVNSQTESVKHKHAQRAGGNEEEEDDDEEEEEEMGKPEDLKMLENLLESFAAQTMGRPGPSQMLLNSLGYTIPRDDSEEEDDN